MSAARGAVVGGLLLTSACGPGELPPLGQIRLHVTTDAPLPAAEGRAPSPWDAPPLFDRLRVDLLRPGEDVACGDCLREFPIDESLVDPDSPTAEGGSFGVILPPGATGYRARLRLYRERDRGEEPAPDSTLDLTVALPAVAEEGIVDYSAVLWTDDVGHRVGFPEPAAVARGRPAPGLVGSWPGARRVGCADPAPPGMVCIPGGAFWMGTPRAPDAGGGHFADRQRLVVLSPFYLDATEVIVASFREYGYIHTPSHHWSGNLDGQSDEKCGVPPVCLDWCTFTPLPGDRDALPMTCLHYEEALGYCRWRGADLPTEAELEYVAGGLSSSLYVWGDDDPSCPDAIFGRSFTFNGPCRSPGDIGGAIAGAAEGRARDRLDSPAGGTVFDAAGNVSEYARGLYNEQDGPCWAAPGVYVDPVCETPDGGQHVRRRIVGGAWSFDASLLRAAVRLPLANDPLEVPDAERLRQLHVEGGDVGFRCGLPAKPAAP